MNRVVAITLVVLIAGAGALAVIVVELSGRIDGLERASRAEPAPRTSGVDLAKLGERIDALEARVRGLEERSDAPVVPVVDTPAGAGDEDVPAGADAGDAAALAKRVEELEREMKERDDPLDDNDPRLAALVERLELTTAQATDAEREIDEGKRVAFELLDLSRPDGPTMADDLIRRLREGDNEEAAVVAWFGRLFVEKVPGRDETYMSALQKIENETWARLERVLTPDQVKKLKGSDVEILEVKTTYRPFEERMAER